MHKNQSKALFLALISVLLWSTVASAFKLSLRYIDPITLLLYASLTSFIVLFSILVIQKKIYLFFLLSRKTYLSLMLLGLINPFIYYLLLFRAYELLPAQEAQAINYTWALVLSYLSVWILKHPLHVRDSIAGIICYIGVLIIATHGHPFSFELSNAYGVFLALCSTLLWALYWLFNARLSVDPVVGLSINFATALPFIFVWALCFSDPFVIPLYGFLGAVYVGIFEMGLTFVLWLLAIKLSSNASQIANLIFISPFISLGFIAFVLDETINISTLIGLSLIVFGLLFQRLARRV